MGVGILYFVVDDHDNVMTLSKQRVTDIFDGRRGEPEWAGKTIRYLQVIVTVENRRVVKVHDVQGLQLTLDAEGRHSEEAQTAALRAAVHAAVFGRPDTRPWDECGRCQRGVREAGVRCQIPLEAEPRGPAGDPAAL